MKRLSKITLCLAMAWGIAGAGYAQIQPQAASADGQISVHHAQKQDGTTAKTLAAGELHYVDNVQSPEDLLAIPGSKWIIASGMAPQSGLYLIDSESKKAERWFAPQAAAPSPQYSGSAPQPHPDEMQIHGISLRETGQGKALLYAVNHNGKEIGAPTRETIEIFEVDTKAEKPALTWLGNVRLPEGLAGNGVVSAADGSIYTTVMLHPGDTLDDMFAGKPTGAVYRWTPQTRHFEKLQGTELNGNNGIELSHDGKYIYVAHMQGMSKLTNANPAKPVATAWLDYGLADNLHWDGERLVTAGSMLKNCHQGVRPDCLDGFHISHIDPESLETRPVIQGSYTDKFSGVSTVLPLGDTFWLGSFYRDRVAYFRAH